MTGFSCSITPRWLRLKDAALYSAIGRQRLIALVEEGSIRGFQDPDSGRNDWIFDRQSIDQYREKQASTADVSKKADQILRSIN